MKNMETEYKELIKDIIAEGEFKDDRTGVGTLSIFGRTIEHDMRRGFPLLTSKFISFNNVVTELLWILNGRTDLQYLEDHGVKYWRKDYERSGRTDGTLGPVYGKQWRDFNGVDQLKNLVFGIRENPNSRRLMVSAWNPEDMSEMALPPCHHSFQVYVNNGRLDLLWMQRSADVFLGLPYDIGMYGLLLELLAEGAGLVPGRLIGQLGDCHIYRNHILQAIEYVGRDTHALPDITIQDGIRRLLGGTIYIPDHKKIILEDYEYEPPIKAPLNVGT